MAVVCKPKQGVYLTRKKRGWVNSECAQEPGSPQNQDIQQGKVSLVTHQNVSQCVWVSSETGHPERLWNFRAGRHSDFDGKRLRAPGPCCAGSPASPGDQTWDLQAPLPSHPTWKGQPVGRGVCPSGHAGRFETFFTGQPLSWGHCNPKIQFLLCSHQSRELSTTPNWWPLSPKFRQHGCP